MVIMVSIILFIVGAMQVPSIIQDKASWANWVVVLSCWAGLFTICLYVEMYN